MSDSDSDSDNLDEDLKLLLNLVPARAPYGAAEEQPGRDFTNLALLRTALEIRPAGQDWILRKWWQRAVNIGAAGAVLLLLVQDAADIELRWRFQVRPRRRNCTGCIADAAI